MLEVIKVDLRRLSFYTMFKQSTIHHRLFTTAVPASTTIGRMSWTTTILAGFVLLLGLQSAARADTIAYMLTNNEEFGTIDLNTGDFTSDGTQPVQLAGLGEIGSTVYGVNYQAGTGTLYTVNTSTGALTQQGSTDNSVEYAAFGSTLTGLYALQGSQSVFNLYSINPTTAQATLVGSTGIAQSGDFTLSTNSNTLYFTEGSNLYTINTTTGVATLVGATGAAGAGFGALITESGTLYGGQYQDPTAVDTLNTGTGAATFVADLSSSDFGGFAAIPTATPEPGNVALLLAGLLAASVWIKKRRSLRTTLCQTAEGRD
jgi:hypothetical protein